MENLNDLFKHLSDNETIHLGIELLKDGKVNVVDAINYIKVKDKLEKEYGGLHRDSFINKS